MKYLVVEVSRTLTKAAAAVLLALTDAIEEASDAPIAEAAWRAKWRERMPVEMKEEAARKSFCRGRDQLSKMRMVRNDAGLWAATPSNDKAPALLASATVMDFSLAAGTGR